MILALALSAALAATPLPELALEPRGRALRLAVAGDTGEGADAVARGIARVHREQALDAIVLTGDTFYPCGPSAVDDSRWSLVRPLLAVGIPVFPVLGNHDYCGNSTPDVQVRATATLPNWRFPARQYVVRTPPADLVFLDTTPYVRRKNKDAEAVLRKVLGGSTRPWQVVIGHHPLFSSGYHGYFPRDEVAQMRKLLPALRDTRTDFYICGHDHHLELVADEMLHLTSGAGSDPIPPIRLRLKTVYPQEIRFERIGFAVVEITTPAIRVRMYDGEGRPRSEWLARRATPGRTSPGPFRTTSSPSSPRRD